MANQTGFRATTNFTKEDKECSDYCPHVSHKKLKHAVGYFYERDSCGPVAQYIVCESCRVKCQEQEDNQEVVCHDCKQTVLVKNSIEWKWYDFYAPQGDEPIIICNDCRKLQKHIDRVAKDTRDYNEEFGHDDVDDHDDDEDEPDDTWFVDDDDLPEDDEFEEEDEQR